jgi:histone deacetylase 6
MGRHPLLVIFHDPPNFRDNPNPVTGKRELHNTWLVSGSAVLYCVNAD